MLICEFSFRVTNCHLVRRMPTRDVYISTPVYVHLLVMKSYYRSSPTTLTLMEHPVSVGLGASTAADSV